MHKPLQLKRNVPFSNNQLLHTRLAVSRVSEKGFHIRSASIKAFNEIDTSLELSASDRTRRAGMRLVNHAKMAVAGAAAAALGLILSSSEAFATKKRRDRRWKVQAMKSTRCKWKPCGSRHL